MTPLLWALAAGWGAICTVWGVLLLSQRRVVAEGLVLPPLAGPPGGDEPAACVVIPACNESTTLDRCLRVVAAQDHPRLSVVVVDDRSEDDTRAIAARWAARDGRFFVVTVDALPRGWLGKSHALWRGTRSPAAAEAQWLLFLDADCTLAHPAAVRTAVAEAGRRGGDLLTLWPRQAAGGFWEHLLIPLCAGIIAQWFGGSRRDSGPAFGNGQFLLVRRAAYERFGGHRAVRRQLIEDVPLAEHARARGLRTLAAGGRELVAVRMYDGYRSTRDGWARIYAGALRSTTKIGLSVLWLAFGSLLPFVAAPLLLYDATAARPQRVPAAFGLLCAQHLVLMAVVSYRFWGLGACRRAYLWLYPASVVLVIGILLRAGWWLAVRRSVAWRGTRYAIDGRGRLAC